MKFLVARRSPRERYVLGALSATVLLVLTASWTTLLNSSAGVKPAVMLSSSQYGSQPDLDPALMGTCERPAEVKSERLERWGCKLLRDSCLDQGRILLHTGQKTPGHPNWTDEPLFSVPEPPPTLVLPGYPEPLGTVHYMPANKFSMDIRAPTPLDPQDVWRPAVFNNCTLPLIFSPWYFSIYGEFFMRRVTALSDMSAERVFDQEVIFTVDANGMEPPAFYQLLLEPFSRHKVESLYSLSSRERAHEGRPRCYSQLVLCQLGWGSHNFKAAATRIKEYYKSKFPEKFEPPADYTTFRVAFFNRSEAAQGGARRMVNLDEVLEQCQRWQLPEGSRFKSVECFAMEDFTPETMVDGIAKLQGVHALVSLHGSGLNNGYFLPELSAVVEVLCWNFLGSWPDAYGKLSFEIDQSVNSGYFRLVADKDRCFPGEFERNGTGSTTAYARDQHISIEFRALSKALVMIALGEVHSTPENFNDRVFTMMPAETSSSTEVPAAAAGPAPTPEGPTPNGPADPVAIADGSAPTLGAVNSPAA